MQRIPNEFAYPFLEAKGLMACNALMTLKNKTTAEVYADHPEQPTALIILDGSWVIPVDTGFNAVLELMSRKNISSFGIGACFVDYYEEALHCPCRILWTEYCHVFAYTGEKPEVKLPEGFTLGSLTLDDAAIIDAHYTYHSEHSLQEIQNDIRDRHSIGIRSKSGELVSWVLVHPDGSMGIMYTKGDFRKLGLGHVASNAMICKQIEAGCTPYVHIVHGNEASIGLATKLGMSHVMEVIWFGVETGKPAPQIRHATEADRSAALLVEKNATPGLQYLDGVYDAWLGDPHGPLLVAEAIENEVKILVGVAKFSVLPDGSAWLEALRVPPSHQGHGIGKAFYEVFLTLAKEKDIHTLRMYTGVSNVTSKGLAEHFGFTLDGTFRSASLSISSDAIATAVPGFLPISDHHQAKSLIEKHRAKWNDYAVMNRTFFDINDATIEDWTTKGQIYADPASDAVIVLGARFLPKQALHIALFGGNPERALAFAREKTIELGNHKLVCMFPASSEAIRSDLVQNGFKMDAGEFIVMKKAGSASSRVSSTHNHL